MKRIFLFILLFVFVSCDTKKDNKLDGYLEGLLCYSGAICSQPRGTKFGMVGDSWTDFGLSVELIEDLRDNLVKYHGYNIAGSTLAGQTIDVAFNSGLHYRTIDTAGPDIHYMLLSLGGNDILENASGYKDRVSEEKQVRLESIRNYLLNMVRTGNAYKIEKYGGGPLTWIIHGYDYTNPDNDATVDGESSYGCRKYFQSAGLTATEIEALNVDYQDELNTLYYNLTLEEPQLKYIDLRNTLEGPPSNEKYMFDCIHPNHLGFRLLAERYVSILEGYTNYEK